MGPFAFCDNRMFLVHLHHRSGVFFKFLYLGTFKTGKLELPTTDTGANRGIKSRKATLSLIAICCIAYPAGFRYSYLQCSYDNIFLSGNWWSVFTALFLHGNLMHLLGNMLFLLLFGLGLEKKVGPGRLIAVFLLGGAISMFLSSFYYPHNQPSVGASGAIATILAALMLFNPWRISFLLNFFPMPIGVAGFTFLLLNIGGLYRDFAHPSVSNFHVAYMGHLIGFLVGIVFASVVTPDWKKNLVLSVIQFIGFYALLLLIFHYL